MEHTHAHKMSIKQAFRKKKEETVRAFRSCPRKGHRNANIWGTQGLGVVREVRKGRGLVWKGRGLVWCLPSRPMSSFRSKSRPEWDYRGLEHVS